MTRPWSGRGLKQQTPWQSGRVYRRGGCAGERTEGISMAAVNKQSNVSRQHCPYAVPLILLCECIRTYVRYLSPIQVPLVSGPVYRRGGCAGERTEGISMGAVNKQSNVSRQHSPYVVPLVLSCECIRMYGICLLCKYPWYRDPSIGGGDAPESGRRGSLWPR